MYCISFSQGKQIHTVITEFNENENLVKKWFDSLNHTTTKVIYYSHNLTFGGYILLKNLIDLDKKLKWLCIDYNIYYIKTIYNGIQIELRCSYKMFINKFSRSSISCPFYMRILQISGCSIINYFYFVVFCYKNIFGF